MSRKALGRGLDALIPQGGATTPTPPATSPLSAGAPTSQGAPTQGAVNGEVVVLVDIDRIVPNRRQPRSVLDEAGLAELTDSIRERGVLEPLLVRPIEDGRYELVAGERRLRASQKAGKSQVPVLVRQVGDRASLEIALIENIQRQDLNAMEEADALERLTREFGLTHEQVARAVGRSRVAVSNLLRLRQLVPKVRELVEQRRLEMGHARALLALEAADQLAFAERVVAQALSVRQTEQIVARHLRGEKAPPAARAPSADVRHLEKDLAERLGAAVSIEHGRRGGKLVIRYNSLDELDGILGHIR